MGPVAQPDNDNQGLAMWVDWLPFLGHTLMRLKFKALSSRIGSAFGVALKKQASRSNFGQMQMGCRLIASPTSKIKRVAYLLKSKHIRE